MDDGVVSWAQECAVGEVGGAAVDPVPDVMGVAQVRGRSQPGKVQCRSRSHRALVWAVVKYRWSRPQCRMCPSGAWTTGMTVPSQASIRTVSGPSRVPPSTPPTRTPGRVRSFRSSRPMVTMRVALVPDGVTVVGLVTARRQTWTRASPRRWSMVRGSRSPSTTSGLARTLMAASTTARASGLSRIRYSVIPPPMSCPQDRTVSPRCRSSRSCSRSPSPYRASRAGRTRRTPCAPSTSPIATRPAATASTAPGSSSGVSCRSSAATTQLADTGSRPSCTAIRAAVRSGAASSLTALATSPASRASRDGHRSATHCWVDPACDEATSPRSTASAVMVNRPAAATAASRSTNGSTASRSGPVSRCTRAGRSDRTAVAADRTATSSSP